MKVLPGFALTADIKGSSFPNSTGYEEDAVVGSSRLNS